MPKKPATFIQEENRYIFECPHCDGVVQVNRGEIACSIFRHAIYKSTGEQLNPHAPKMVCDSLLEKGLIFGCGKPFQFFLEKEPYVEECNYV